MEYLFLNKISKVIIMNPPKRKRITKPKMSLANYILHHSPIKAGLRVIDEDKPLAQFNKITDRIYVGNFEAAKDHDFFKNKRIGAVLNCTKDIPNYFEKNPKIEYMRIPVEDSLKEKDFELMYQFMPCIVEFIHKHVNIQKNNILIHCWAGRQRSIIAAACFMVGKHNMTPKEACKFVLEKRPEAFHFGQSLNFDQSLNKFYKSVVTKK